MCVKGAAEDTQRRRRYRSVSSTVQCIFLVCWLSELRGYASPVLTETGFVNERWQFSTPHRIHTPWQITTKFVASHYVGDPYGCAKFGANQSTGGFWKNGWNITKILFIYLFVFFSELIYRSEPSTDFYAWWLKRRVLAQGCAFWGFRRYYSPF